MNYCVYLARCGDNSLYCGSTTDLRRRLDEHNLKRGAKYTATRLPVTLAQAWSVSSWSHALRLEAALKKCTHRKKEELVKEPLGIIEVAERFELEFPILVY